MRAAVCCLAASVAGIAMAQWHTPLQAPKSPRENAARISRKSAKALPQKVVAVDNGKLLKTPLKINPPSFVDNLPVLYGSVIYSDADWFIAGNTQQFGYYGFQPQSAIRFQPIVIHPNLYVNGGGAYSDRRLHYHIWEMFADDTSDTGITFNHYYGVVNTDNWSYVNGPVDMDEDQESIAYDMTYDPVTGNLYAMVWGPYEDSHCDFVTVDKMTGQTNVIAKMPAMSVLASDNFGNLFAVGGDGNTYYIDKNDGSRVLLGSSGIMPKYMQSATVDPETNTIYWAASTENNAGLYTIDTHTGKAVRIADMPDAEEVTGLFIEAPRKGLNAPAALENVALSYEAGKSMISANIPTKAFDGSQLAGEVEVKLYIDGQLADTRKGNPGSAVSFSKEVADGSHTVILSAYNQVGEGPKTVRSQWCGNDVPGAVGNLRLTLDGNNASLTWDAPTEGMNGGTVDPAAITYNVNRFPGNIEVAKGISQTSFSETLPDGIATYYYTVTPVNSLGEGRPAISNSCFMGSAFTVPYSQTFDTAESLEGFTIINSEEGRGWYWWNNTALNFQAMASRFSMENASDNWLILPSIEFRSSSEYKLRFSARVFDTDSPEKFEVTIGQGATVEAQTKNLVNATTIKNETAKIYEVPFTVAADGTWNIAFHCISPIKAYYLIIDDIEIVETASAEGPAPVSDLTAAAAEGGRLEATLSFTLPTKSHSGNTLAGISKVCIYRGEQTTPCGELTGVAPGQRCSWTDRNAQQGENTYRVAAFSGDSKGTEASVSVYVGYDTPMPVTAAKATEGDNQTVRISWKAPAKGVQGGDLVASEVSYRVLANNGDVLADGIKETSFTDTRFSGASTQKMTYYQIHALYGPMMSEGILTDFIIMGPDMAVPFAESFSDGGLQNTPWTLSTLAGNIAGCWELSSASTMPAAQPQDADNGMAVFKGNTLPSGVSARMTSPKIDLFSADHPMLSFWVYIPGNGTRDQLELQITHNDNVFTTLQTINLSGEEGWKEFKVEIPRIHCTESSMVAFKATAAGYGKNICIDNIRITEDASLATADTDLQAVDITLPDEFMPGETKELIVSVYNNGRKSVANYTVTLYCDGNPAMQTDGKAIAPGETINYIFKATADESDRGVTYRYRGGVSAPGDENTANDTTAEKSITIGVSGIGGITADGIRVFANRQGINIIGAAGKHYSIVSAAGATVAAGTAQAATIERLPAGMYMVTVAGHTVKVLLP